MRSAVYEITIRYAADTDKRLYEKDSILWIDYVGNEMDVYCGNRKINDHFYTGELVPIRLSYFGFPEKLTVKVRALQEDDWVYLEKWPEQKDGRRCRLNGVTVTDEYR